MNKKYTLLTMAILTVLTLAHAERFPGPDWKEEPDLAASPYAEVGGELVFAGNNPPKSFNSYLDLNTFTNVIFSMMYPAMLSIDQKTGDLAPAVADWWEVSDDKLTYTFHIDARAKWNDGSPITAHDVKATFDAVMDPENITGPYKVMFADFKSPTVIDDATIAFTSTKAHWRNITTIGLSLQILPKAMLDKKPLRDYNFEFPIISGPYRVSEHKEGVSMTLTRCPEWWIFHTVSGKGVYNFERIRIRFFMDQNNAFEAFKKGDVDIYPVYMARLWNSECVGERFEKNWVVKQAVENHDPLGFQGFAFNMRRKPYDDIRVRKALAMLFDRRRMVRTLMFNAYQMQRSYFEDLYSEEHPCQNTLIEYDPKAAYALLQEAGFAINPETGLMERDGKPLVVKIMTRAATDAIYLALYKASLESLGIRLMIDQKDFATWMREMENYNFDVTSTAFSGSLFRDPEAMWYSKYADVVGGNNQPGVKNAEIDALIEAQMQEFSGLKRNEILRKLDKIATDLCPHALGWYVNSTRLLFWNRFGTPDTILGKYGDELSILSYWWYDQDSAKALNKAMKEGTPLPARPAIVNFDEVMSKKAPPATSEPTTEQNAPVPEKSEQ